MERLGQCIDSNFFIGLGVSAPKSSFLFVVKTCQKLFRTSDASQGARLHLLIPHSCSRELKTLSDSRNNEHEKQTLRSYVYEYVANGSGGFKSSTDSLHRKS